MLLPCIIFPNVRIRMESKITRVITSSEITALNIRKSVNKAFLQVKTDISRIDTFKANLSGFPDQIKESESEEFHKYIISGFLKSTCFSQKHYINTKGRAYLVTL